MVYNILSSTKHSTGSATSEVTRKSVQESAVLYFPISRSDCLKATLGDLLLWIKGKGPGMSWDKETMILCPSRQEWSGEHSKGKGQGGSQTQEYCEAPPVEMTVYKSRFASVIGHLLPCSSSWVFFPPVISQLSQWQVFPFKYEGLYDLTAFIVWGKGKPLENLCMVFNKLFF